jgi:hypothetical protein
MTPTALNLAELDQLPIQVLEVHVDDRPVCGNCRWPRALDGRCRCDDFQPRPHTTVLIYTDVRATRAANSRCA